MDGVEALLLSILTEFRTSRSSNNNEAKTQLGKLAWMCSNLQLDPKTVAISRLQNHCQQVLTGVIVFCVSDLERNDDMNTCDQRLVTPLSQIDALLRVWVGPINTFVANDAHVDAYSFWLNVIFEFFCKHENMESVQFKDTISFSHNKNVFVFKLLVFFRVLALINENNAKFSTQPKDTNESEAPQQDATKRHAINLDKVYLILQNINNYMIEYDLNRLFSIVYNGRALWISHSKYVHSKAHHLRGMLQKSKKSKKKDKNGGLVMKLENETELENIKIDPEHSKLLMKSYYFILSYVMIFLKPFLTFYFANLRNGCNNVSKSLGYYIFLSKIDSNNKILLKMIKDHNLTLTLQRQFQHVLSSLFRMVIDANMIFSKSNKKESRFWNYNMEPGINVSGLNFNQIMSQNNIIDTIAALSHDLGRIAFKIFFHDNLESNFKFDFDFSWHEKPKQKLKQETESKLDDSKDDDDDNNELERQTKIRPNEAWFFIDLLCFDLFAHLCSTWKEELLRVGNKSKWPKLEWKNGVLSNKENESQLIGFGAQSGRQRLTELQYYQKFSKRNKVQYNTHLDVNGDNNDIGSEYYDTSKEEAWKYEYFLNRFEMKYVALLYQFYSERENFDDKGTHASMMRSVTKTMNKIVCSQLNTVLGLIFKFIHDWQTFHKVFGLKMLRNYVMMAVDDNAHGNQLKQHRAVVLNILEKTVIHEEDEISDILYPLLIFVVTGRDVTQTPSIWREDVTVSKQLRLLSHRLKICQIGEMSGHSGKTSAFVLNDSDELSLSKEAQILKDLTKSLKQLKFSGPKQDSVRKYWIVAYFYNLMARDGILHCCRLSETMEIICKFIETVDDIKILKLCFDYVHLGLRCCYPAMCKHYSNLIVSAFKCIIKLKKYDKASYVACDLAKHLKQVQQMVETLCVEMIVFCSNEQEIAVTIGKLEKLKTIDVLESELDRILSQIKQVL